MAMFKPYKILSSQLSSLPIKEGQFIITTDTAEMYVDVSASSRIKINESSEEEVLIYEMPSGTSDINIAFWQQIADNCIAGKNSIIFKPGPQAGIYHIKSGDITTARLNQTFRPTYYETAISDMSSYGNGIQIYSRFYSYYIELNSGTVTNVTSNYENITKNVFPMDGTEGYEPTTDYQAATKKYVDEHIQKTIVSETEPTGMNEGDIWMILES